MSKNSIKISFYDEIISVKCPKSFMDFKKIIAKTYFLDPADVDELVIYYINENDRISVSNEMDYQQAITYRNQELGKDKKFYFVIYLEVSEQSKLYRKEAEHTKLNTEELKEKLLKEEKLKREQEEIEKLQKQEALRKEILEKEKMLKEMLEKEREEGERLERERIENERLERIRLEEERLESERIQLEKIKLERENEEKERLERENAEKAEREKALSIEIVTKIVEENINKNIEKIKEQLIKQTIEDSTKILLNKNEVKNENKTEIIHQGYTCDGCGVKPIVGNRYNCTVCFNYDLCQNCEDKGDHLHPLIKHKIVAPRMIGCGPRRSHHPHPHHSPHHGKKHGGPFGFFKDMIKPFVGYEIKNKSPSIKGKKVKKMRELYGLDDKFTDEQISAALEKANGKIEEAINFLLI